VKTSDIYGAEGDSSEWRHLSQRRLYKGVERLKVGGRMSMTVIVVCVEVEHIYQRIRDNRRNSMAETVFETPISRGK
jgi:hypothetical protein